MHQAKTQLSKLVEAAEAGEEVVITRNGKDVARLVSVEIEKPKSTWDALAGKWEGRGSISEDFNEPDEEIERLFGMRE
jgi:prevent-host-death family protein